jgi:ABC-2 type transport system permease protein
MNRFWGFVRKEFYHIIRDSKTVLVLFGMPLAQMFIFGFAISNEIKDVKIAVLDHSKDAITRQIQSRIFSSGFFILNSSLYSETEIEPAFRKGIIKEVVIFESEFAAKLQKDGLAHIRIVSDASDANQANLISNYTNAIISNYVSMINSQEKSPVQIIPEVRMHYNPELKSVFMFVPGTMAMILILVCALMTSISIVREKELGTMEVLLASPLRPLQIIIGKVIPYVVLAFIDAIIIILLSYFVFRLPLQGNMFLLLTETILYVFLALSLGIFISTNAQSQQSAIFISMFAFMLPTILLSGFIFPIENMPKILQWLCALMPPKYFIIIIKNIMLKGTGILYVWKETLILCGMTVFFIILSIKRFKIRLE